MTLQFRYHHTPNRRPILTLGGRFVRPRPIIPVSVIGRTGKSTAFGLVDSGADETVFSDDIALAVGIDLTQAPVGIGTAFGQSRVPLRYAQATLRIETSQEQRQWSAWVGFTSAKIQRPLLGFAGFLQYFDANFQGGLEVLELNVNGLYSGV
jgi:hypothetical protein